MGYIASNANRWYCARESSYGQIPVITADHRIPAVKLSAKHQKGKSTRKDKTGSRTWQGIPAGTRRHTTLDLSTYVRDWADMTKLPSHSPLMEASMGASGILSAGAMTDTGSTTSTVKFSSPHGLQPGQAVANGEEIRFVSAIVDTKTVILNCPFSSAPGGGETLGTTATFQLATELPSLTMLDYWGAGTGVQRAFTGVGIDRFRVQLNGDFHAMEFSGVAQDVIDSASFQSGEGAMPTFPNEPSGAREFSYSVVPGNLGQIWLGAIPNRFFTVADATIEIKNNIQLRADEFGSSLPRAIAPGDREVTVSLEIFAQDDAVTASLYQSARQHLPLSMMFQLGQMPGQLVGIYLQSVIPEVPEFDDSDKRLKWKFRDSQVQGTADDEIVVAFA